MKKQYAIFEENKYMQFKVIKMSNNKKELIDFRNSFPEEVKRTLLLAERIVGGTAEWQQGFWQFNKEEK